jgi:uncharacterized repeat protein (TIGR02543 family)
MRLFIKSYIFCLLTTLSVALFAGPVYDLDTASGRYLSFDDYSLTADGSPATWQHFGATSTGGSKPGTNHLHKSGWSFLNSRMGRLATGTSVPPSINDNAYVPGSTNYCAYFQNTLLAKMESPVFVNGAGAIYFDIISVTAPATLPVIKVYIATNIVENGNVVYPIPDTEWIEIDSLTLTSGVLLRYSRTLNYGHPIAIKFVRTTINGIILDNFFVAIDNIRVSPPPADVIMDQGLSPFNVYPSVNSDINLQLKIDNTSGLYTSAGETQRTNVFVVSRWNYLGQRITPWTTNAMTCIDTGDGLGNNELWRPSAALPRYTDAGNLEYYFVCYFNGDYYQSKDYTTNPPVLNTTTFPPENRSPRTYSAAGITMGSSATNTPFVFPLRLFPSSHDTVNTVLFVNGSPIPQVLPMSLSNTNRWQAKYDIVNHPDVTNLLWYFEATGAYTNSFMPSTNKVYWQNTNISRIQNGILPYGDNCGITDASIESRPADWFGVTTVPGESSYVLFTLDTGRTNYIAGRGEYQNFNNWNVGTGAENSFTDADDKYPKTAYPQTFSNGWTANTFAGLSNWFGLVVFTNQTSTLRVGPDAVLGGSTYWNAGSFQYVIERTAVNGLVADAPGAVQRRNQSIRLLGGADGLGLGYYQGNSVQQNFLRGLGNVSFKARFSRPLAIDSYYNYNVAYRWTDMTRSNVVIKSYIRAVSLADMSPENPSVSLIAYYLTPQKFYEYRLIQVTDSRGVSGTTVVIDGATSLPRDKRVRHEIWKWNGSNTPVRLAYSERVAASWPDANYDGWLHTSPGGGMTSFRVYNNETSTSLALTYNTQPIVFTPENGATVVNGAVVDSSSPLRFGSYGFHSADCRLFVSEMQIGVSTTDAADSGIPPTHAIGGTSSNHINEWNFPPELYSISGITFVSTTPSTQVKMLTGTSELGPWTTCASQSINSYGYQTITATTNSWDSRCARIQVDNDPDHVVIDGVSVTSWRAETVTSSPSDGWKITEGWLSSNVTDRSYAHLDASQADPVSIQGVRSKQLTGLGSLLFDYRVMNAPAKLKIQYTASAFPDSTSSWFEITNCTFLTTSGGWLSTNLFLGIAPATNIYVRIINDLIYTNKGIIDLRNITLWNNPTNSPNDWAAYNMKITATETNKWWVDSNRSGYLNNGTTNNIIPGRPMDMFEPFIMAPRLTRGLGTVSFLARAFTTNYMAGNPNTSISIFATTDAWNKYTPDYGTNGWTKLCTFINITNAFYRPFIYNYPTLPNNIKAVKLVVEGVRPLVGSPQRVCIDEIVLTEAIYPRFDITGVKLLKQTLPTPTETKQPLEGEDIGIQAQLTNVLMDPQDIKLWVTYVVGTNTWGVFNAPATNRITKAMDLVDTTNNIYRITGDFMTTGIPEQDKYTVVQYIVWAQYEGNGYHEIYQTPNTADQFLNPSWYFPVDFNKVGDTYSGAQKPTWSPYYIVYDVPPGSVWINELNLNENYSLLAQKIFMNPYIEIAQPAWMSLKGWTVEVLDRDHEPRLTKTINSNTTVSPALGGNGYGLFVVGPADSETNNYVPPYPPLSTTTTVHQSAQNIRDDSGASLYPGGYRLKRPMGMYEQAIACDWDPGTLPSSTGIMFQNADPTFRYVGREHYNGSLSFTGAVNITAGQYFRMDSTNSWEPGLSTLNWTPGKMNIGQAFPSMPVPIENGMTNLFFISPRLQLVNYVGGVHALFVGSTTNWSVSESETWITPLITSGNERFLQLPYQVALNSNRSPRVGYLSIISEGITNTLQITQEGEFNFNRILETSNLVWNAGGDAYWFEQTTVVKTGDSALQSGGISHNQQTWIEATVQGPGFLSFWWKVSSESQNDVLTCSLKNSTVAQLSGTTLGDWRQETLLLESETNTIRWTYSKNGSVSMGDDAAWLDDIEWVPVKTVSVLFDPQFGTLEPTNRLTYIVGMPYGTLPTPTPTSGFDGWYTEADGGTRILANSIVSESTHTLFARWTYSSPGDIIGFYSSSANSTFTTPGSTVEFTIRLYGTIIVSNLFTTTCVLPQIRLETGSDTSSSAYATLVSTAWTGTPFDLFNRTDLTFAYTIRPGDMAAPLKIFETLASGFTILNNQCWIYKAYPGGVMSNITWKVDATLYDYPGGVFDSSNPYGTIAFGDLNMAYQKIVVKTLSYDAANSPNTLVADAPDQTWRIQSGGTSSIPVKVMVWTPHTNILQIVGSIPVGSVPGNGLEVTIPAGSDYVDFPVRGLGTNTTPAVGTIYAQRPSDYLKNETVITNFISRSVTILNSMTILFDPSGGTVTPTNKTVACGLAHGELPTPSFIGYTFEGWYTAIDENGTRIFTNSIVSASNHTLFARWTINQYPLSYGNTRGLYNPNPAFYSVTNAFTFGPLSDVDGYAFTSWSPLGITLGTTGSVTATANWTLKTFNINYVNVKGVLNTNRTIYTTQDAFVFNPLANLPGYTFKNWSISGVTNGMSGDLTVTASWTNRSFIVALDPQGGGVTHASISVLYEAFYTGLPTPTFEDALFSGWWSEPNGKGTNIDISAVVLIASNHSLHAKWDINSVVGTTGLFWRTGDKDFWFPQNTTTNQGPLAMQSGQLADNETSWIETTITGPSVLRFRWKVDSEDACDQLSVRVGGEIKDVISGKDIPWATKELVLPAGEQTIRWEYTKDTSEAVGLDCGWLDHVEFIRTSVFFDAQGGSVNPTNKFVLYGDPYGELPVASLSNATMEGWWTLPNGKGSQVTSNTLVATYDNFSLYAKWNINSVLGTSSWTWTTDGTDGAFWFPESLIHHADQPLAMQAGAISHNASTWIETAITNAGTLSFRWAISAELNKDVMICTTNGGHFKTLSSKTLSWTQESITVSNPPVVIRWTFSKDGSTNIGTNSAWIAAFVWTAENGASGFDQWAKSLGLEGTLTALFAQDRNTDGIANGFEYAFGTNLPLSSLLLNIRFVNGKAIVEIPKQDESTLPYVNVHVHGSTNLLDWTLPMIPATDTTGKPAYQSWHEPQGTLPNKAFFKVGAELK